MLRSVLSRSSSALAGSCRNVASHSLRKNPSTNTSVLLSRLPTSTIESELKTALAGVKSRRVELEPGCSLHFVNECEANIASKSVEAKFNMQTLISRVTMPCLLLQNIPDDITADSLTKAFAAQSPKSIHISGVNTLKVTVPSSADALLAMTALHKVHIDGHTLRVTGTKVSDTEHVLSIFNFPSSRSVESVAEEVTQALHNANVKKHSEIAMVSHGDANKKTVSLRFPTQANVDPAALAAALEKSHPGAFKISKFQQIKKPALFLRKLEFLEVNTLETFLNGHEEGIERIQWVRDGPDVDPHMAVVYFKSEEPAFATMKYLCSTSFDQGHKISCAYREVSEPVVLLNNLAATTTAESLTEFCFIHKFDQIDIFDNADGSKSARLFIESPRDSNAVVHAFNQKIVDGNKITATAMELFDQGVEIVPTGKARADELTPSAVAASVGAIAQPKSIAYQTNTNAHIGFLTVQDAQRAMDRFNRGDVTLKVPGASSSAAGSLVGSSISVLPAYVLQVQGLGAEMPVRAVTDHLTQDVPSAKVIKADRSALLKFRKAADIAPGLKALKEVRLEGQPIKAARYRPLEIEGDSAYDTVTSAQHKEHQEFDRYNLVALMKDFMHLDPATRYQLAKNKFMRALHDARNEDVYSDEEGAAGGAESEGGMKTLFLANFNEMSGNIISDLFHMEGIAEDMDQEEADVRLFRYYLQTEDMKRLSFDFREIESMLGLANETDEANWAVPIDVFAEYEADESARAELLAKAKGRASTVLASTIKEIDAARAARKAKHQRKLDAGGSDGEYEEFGEGSDGDEGEMIAKAAAGGPGSASDSDDEFLLAGMGNSSSSDEEAAPLGSVVKNGSGSSSSSSSDSNSDIDSDAMSETEEGNKKLEEKRKAQRLKAFREANSTVEIDGSLTYENPLKEKKFLDEEGNRLNLIQDKNYDYIDSSGSVWNMMVIDTDVVQKTLAGGRFISHRALVTMGNLRGSGGFGMGKGKAPPQALAAACRNALRNLVHIDLYDNFGLAHDLYGKHNACHCIIRATPKAREMVASPMIEEILNRMGIVSASVKIVGNRNPYSVVNALFNALSRHQNLDEYAKARGKRYLTIRWAHEHNL